jgi:hypothetical protein
MLMGPALSERNESKGSRGHSPSRCVRAVPGRRPVRSLAGPLQVLLGARGVAFQRQQNVEIEVRGVALRLLVRDTGFVYHASPSRGIPRAGRVGARRAVPLHAPRECRGDPQDDGGG